MGAYHDTPINEVYLPPPTTNYALVAHPKYHHRIAAMIVKQTRDANLSEFTASM